MRNTITRGLLATALVLGLAGSAQAASDQETVRVTVRINSFATLTMPVLAVDFDVLGAAGTAVAANQNGGSFAVNVRARTGRTQLITLGATSLGANLVGADPLNTIPVEKIKWTRRVGSDAGFFPSGTLLGAGAAPIGEWGGPNINTGGALDFSFDNDVEYAVDNYVQDFNFVLTAP